MAKNFSVFFSYKINNKFKNKQIKTMILTITKILNSSPITKLYNFNENKNSITERLVTPDFPKILANKRNNDWLLRTSYIMCIFFYILNPLLFLLVVVSIFRFCFVAENIEFKRLLPALSMQSEPKRQSVYLDFLK